MIRFDKLNLSHAFFCLQVCELTSPMAKQADFLPREGFFTLSRWADVHVWSACIMGWNVMMIFFFFYTNISTKYFYKLWWMVWPCRFSIFCGGGFVAFFSIFIISFIFLFNYFNLSVTNAWEHFTTREILKCTPPIGIPVFILLYHSLYIAHNCKKEIPSIHSFSIRLLLFGVARSWSLSQLSLGGWSLVNPRAHRNRYTIDVPSVTMKTNQLLFMIRQKL